MKNLKLTPVLLPTDDVTDGMLLLKTKEFYTPRNSNSCATKAITPELFIKTKHTNFSRDIHQPVYLYLTSQREIKKGNWYFNFPQNAVEKSNYDTNGGSKEYQVIEATNDPKLIANGVPALPEKAFVEIGIKNFKDNEIVQKVNFLEEFCKWYNQKQSTNVKEVNVDINKYLQKIGEDYCNQERFKDSIVNPQTKIDALIYGYKLALQSNSDKKWTDENMRKCWEKSDGWNFGDKHFKEYLQSLTPKQEEIGLYMEMEETHEHHLSIGFTDKEPEQIPKLNKEGAITVIFK